MAIKNKLSIYLVKEGLEDKKDIFDKPNDLRELQKYADGSVAYYVPSNTHKPSWLKSFFLNSNNSELWQANSRVVLLKQLSIGNEKRIFALTFGYARFLFKENVLEEQFGLRVILNTIQQNQIRRIAKSSVGSNQKQSDEQMPKSSDISEFGFDINRDLMRNVSGKSDDEMFENSMLTGGDIFSLTVSRDISHLFNQALVAGQAWFDNDFRTQLHEKLKEAGEQDYIEEPFKSSDYEIIIAIINKFDDERPKIPFFSKVAICYAAKNMKNAGYNVKLKNIKMRSLDD